MIATTNGKVSNRNTSKAAAWAKLAAVFEAVGNLHTAIEEAAAATTDPTFAHRLADFGRSVRVDAGELSRAAATSIVGATLPAIE